MSVEVVVVEAAIVLEVVWVVFNIDVVDQVVELHLGFLLILSWLATELKIINRLLAAGILLFLFLVWDLVSLVKRRLDLSFGRRCFEELIVGLTNGSILFRTVGIFTVFLLDYCPLTS